MEPAITGDKQHNPAAARFCSAPRFLCRTVLTPTLALALLIYAHSSLPKLLSFALEHTSKETMFFFCNGILLFLAKGSTLIVRPLPRCAAAVDDEGRCLPAGSTKSGSATGRQQVTPGTVVTVREVAEFAGTKLRAAVAVKQEQEQEEYDQGQQSQQTQGAALEEVEAGEISEEDISEEACLQMEDDVIEEDDCPLSPEELKKKADDFIENFKRQRSFEATQLVVAR